MGNITELARENNMSIIAWLVLGLIAGFIASKIVDKEGKGLLINILIGVVGAELGGFLGGRAPRHLSPADPPARLSAART